MLRRCVAEAVDMATTLPQESAVRRRIQAARARVTKAESDVRAAALRARIAEAQADAEARISAAEESHRA